MAQRQFEVNEAQQRDLKAAEQLVKRVSDMKRLMAVRVYGEGYRTEAIEAIVGCTWRSLMRWVEDYRREGVSGVLDQRRGGNRAKLSAEQRAEMKERLNMYRPDHLLPPGVRVEQGALQRRTRACGRTSLAGFAARPIGPLDRRGLSHTLVDAHIYVNHIDGLKEQLKREPKQLPRLEIARKPIDELQFDDFTLVGYEYYEPIKFEVAV